VSEHPVVCPGCGAVAVDMGAHLETVHDDDCEWFHGPDPLESDDD
jgi:hypothetical protein